MEFSQLVGCVPAGRPGGGGSPFQNGPETDESLLRGLLCRGLERSAGCGARQVSKPVIPIENNRKADLRVSCRGELGLFLQGEEPLLFAKQ